MVHLDFYMHFNLVGVGTEGAVEINMKCQKASKVKILEYLILWEEFHKYYNLLTYVEISYTMRNWVKNDHLKLLIREKERC